MTMQSPEDPEHDAKDMSALSTSSDPNATTDDFPSTGAVYGSVEPHIFTNPARADHWQKVYEGSRYECRHRFDPSFEWTAGEEKKATRKVWCLAPISSISSWLINIACLGGLAHYAVSMGYVLVA